jgi:hypothetical protein
MKPSPLSLRDALRRKKPVPSIPAGWSTLSAIAAAEEVSIVTARLMVNEAVTLGIFETKRWPQQVADGRVLRYPIYRRTGK